MYTADGVLCYVTPLLRKENIRTNLCIQSGFPLKPKDLLYNIFNFSDMYSCFQLLPLFFVCCCARACEGSHGQHEIL